MNTSPRSERQTRALSHLDLSGLGLEIGGGYDPLVTKDLSARIETLDHSSRDELVAKYVGFGLPQAKLDAIGEVDHVWAGGTLVDAIGKSGCYDYVVAAHVIEHSVDLIAFLRDCEALLREGGRLALVVPDQRYCFDYFKPLTSVGSVVDAHLRPTVFHPPGPLLDHVAYACTLDGQIAWSPAQEGALDLQFTELGAAQGWIDSALAQDAYQDVHRWIFTPTSFALLIEDLAELGYHTLTEVGSAPTWGFEFYVTLEKNGQQPSRALPRLERLRQIGDETAVVARDGDLPDGRAVTKQTALENAQAALAEMKASTSWRVTRPLRAASDQLRSLRARRR